MEEREGRKRRRRKHTGRKEFLSLLEKEEEEKWRKDGGKGRKKLKELKDLGLKIAIDDFGTGYSSLGYLMELDVDIIKIDRKFVVTADGQKGKKLLKNIIKMVKDLGCKVIIEGVEKDEDVELIKSFGGEYIQGFYYSKPLSLDRMIEYLKKK